MSSHIIEVPQDVLDAVTNATASAVRYYKGNDAAKSVEVTINRINVVEQMNDPHNCAVLTITIDGFKAQSHISQSMILEMSDMQRRDFLVQMMKNAARLRALEPAEKRQKWGHDVNAS